VRFPLSLAIVLGTGLMAGCLAPTAKTPVKGSKPRTGVAVKADAGGRLPLAEPKRVIDPADLTAKTKLTAAELVGKAKLISDKGLGVISNNSGSLLSNNGAGLISDKGGGLISDKGGGVIGQNGANYALLQAKGARPESLLADAEIEVLDAAGRVLVGPDGKPLGAVTGKDGAFALSASLPAENLVLRIRLYQGGQLFAMLPKDRRSGTLDLDTASSLGARYVLDRFVKGAQAVYDRLPGTEADALRAEIEAARGLLGDEAPAYRPADLVEATEALRKDATVDRRIETIEAILLAGQADLGAGLPATRVALSLPTGVVGDAAGNLYVAEMAAFRIRKIDREGRITVFAGTGARDADGAVQGQTLEAVSGVAMGPDGNLYVTQTLTGQIRRITPAGVMTPMLDVAAGAGGALDSPGAIAAGPDGTLYVGEAPNSGAERGRLVAVKDGVVTDLAPPGAGGDTGKTSWEGVAVAPDGTVFAAEGRGRRVHRRKPGGAFEVLVALPGISSLSRLWAEADGSVLVSLPSEHRVVRVAADGTTTTLAGTGEHGLDGDGGPATAARLGQPAGLWRSAAGDLYVADGDGLVRKIASDGVITTVAGTTGLIEGDALSLSVNGPSGLAIDRDGKLVFAEGGSSTIKRLDGRSLTNFAGAGVGYAGDDGPASAAKFANPAGIAYGPDGTLWVIDAFNRAIRKIEPSGVVRTVVKEGTKALNGSSGPYPAGLAPMFEPLHCAVSPKGLLYWSDAKSHQVFRLREDGLAECVVGKYDVADDPAEDKPARECTVHTPLALAFDAKGDLYFVAAGNSRVLRIAQGDPASRVETVVGLVPDKFYGSFLGALAGGAAPSAAADEGKAATDVMLYGVSAICFDAEGGLYVAELGTSKLASFGAASLAGGGIPAEILAGLPQTGTRIRRVGPDGRIRTVAGFGTAVMNDPTTDNMLLYPLSMVVDREGRLIIADTALNQIKMLPKGSY
jgi:DNA-binding beta-propeller fold protein YncE